MLQAAPVFFQQKRSYAEALSHQAMRLRIARGARDPLGADIVLRGGKPLLRQHFDQSCVRIDGKEGEGGVVVGHGLVAGRNDQFFDRGKFRRNADLVGARSERDGDLEFRDGRRGGIDAVARLLEPCCDFGEVESLELVGVETSEA